MYRIEQNQAHHGIPMKDATQYDLLKRLYVTAVPVYDELGKQASNGGLMLFTFYFVLLLGSWSKKVLRGLQFF